MARPAQSACLDPGCPDGMVLFVFFASYSSSGLVVVLCPVCLRKSEKVCCASQLHLAPTEGSNKFGLNILSRKYFLLSNALGEGIFFSPLAAIFHFLLRQSTAGFSVEKHCWLFAAKSVRPG